MMNESIGLGIRHEIFDEVLRVKPNLSFFEAHSENYFVDKEARKKLLRLREQYPISLHSVSLSLGRSDELDKNHIRQLQELIDEVQPCFVSEHLAWTAFQHSYVPDLFPLPLNQQSLAILCEHIHQYQDAIKRQVLIENPSNYLLFSSEGMSEAEFLNTMAEKTGCGILLDVNNVYVSAFNCKADATLYIQSLDSQYIGQYHLAGHTQVERHDETLLIDTHNQQVSEGVWGLYQHTLNVHGVRPTLLEWDSDFPAFSTLLEQCDEISQRMKESDAIGCHVKDQIENQKNRQDNHFENTQDDVDLEQFQRDFMQTVSLRDPNLSYAVAEHKTRISIYQNNVFQAIYEYLLGVYPATCGVVGDTFFKQISQCYFQNRPPETGDIHHYGEHFLGVVDQFEGLQALAYLKDLIGLEWAIYITQFELTIREGFSVLDPSHYTEQELFALELVLNPTVQILQSDYPIYQIWQQSLPDYTDEVSINLDQGQDHLLICKTKGKIRVLSLEIEQMIFIQTLKKTKNLLKTIESLMETVSQEKMSGIISLLFKYQMLLTQDVSGFMTSKNINFK